MFDKLVNFEIAKLAKTKGFDVLVDHAYYINGDTYTLGFSNYDEPWYNEIKCPTQSLLQKWFIEKHNYYVNIFPDYDSKDTTYITSWNCNIINLQWGDDKEHHIEKYLRSYHKSYDDALEEGLFETLKLLL